MCAHRIDQIREDDKSGSGKDENGARSFRSPVMLLMLMSPDGLDEGRGNQSGKEKCQQASVENLEEGRCFHEVQLLLDGMGSSGGGKTHRPDNP